MKRIFKIFMAVPLVFSMVACDNSDKPENPADPSGSTQGYYDLSRDEMANCYIVQKEGSFGFKADNQFNLGAGLPVPPKINPVDVELLWQTVPGSISKVSLVDNGKTPYVLFEVGKAEGNAVIAVLDENGVICWSWHIWMPTEKVEGTMTSTGYEVMNMNLGAMNSTPGDAASYGTLYQWGRKDPFPASATLTGNTSTMSAPMYDIDGNPVVLTHSSYSNMDVNTVEYAVAHPMEVLSNYAQFSTSRDWLAKGDDTLWGNPYGYDPANTNKFPTKGKKTCYDPSPAGWRVAPADVFTDFTNSGGYVWEFADANIADFNGDGAVDMDDYNYGWHFNVGNGKALFFPAAARFDGSYAMLMGSMSGVWGSYWSNAPYHGAMATDGQAFCCLAFQVRTQTGASVFSVSPAAGASKADAYSIRCVRDGK